MDPRVYDALAHEEDQHWWFVGRRMILRDLLRAHLAEAPGGPTRRILDVGCGTGGMYPMLSELGYVEGADSSPRAIAYTNQRFPRFVVHAAALPDELPGTHWDVITAFDVIEHLDDPVACLRSMRDHLAPGGQIALSVPAYQMLWSEHDVLHHHKRRYTRASLTDHLAQAELCVRYITHFNTWLFPVIAGVRLASKLLPAVHKREHESLAPPDTPRFARHRGRAPRTTVPPPFTHAGAPDTPRLARHPGRAPRTTVPPPFTHAGAPKRVNRLLTWIFGSERLALAHTTLPVGVSIFAIAERT